MSETRNSRKVRQGVVVSDANDKTIVECKIVSKETEGQA